MNLAQSREGTPEDEDRYQRDLRLLDRLTIAMSINDDELTDQAGRHFSNSTFGP